MHPGIAFPFAVTVTRPFSLAVMVKLVVVLYVALAGGEVIPTVVELFGVVIELDAAEADEVPSALVAVTVKVYEVFGLKPETVIVPEPDCETVPVLEPGLEVAV